MTDTELTLETDQRQIVESTIADHCRIRRWELLAVNCRTQHVHVVVAAPNRDPDEVMDQFKAWCTRRLKEQQASKPEAEAQVRKTGGLNAEAIVDSLTRSASKQQCSTFWMARVIRRVSNESSPSVDISSSEIEA